jgi:hypothetical protein
MSEHSTHRTVDLDGTLGNIQSSVSNRSVRFERGVCFAYHPYSRTYVVRFSGVTSDRGHPSQNDSASLPLPPTYQKSAGPPVTLTAYNKYWVNQMSVASTVDNSVNIPWISAVESYSPGQMKSPVVDGNGYQLLKYPHAVFCAVDTRLTYVILGRIRGQAPEYDPTTGAVKGSPTAAAVGNPAALAASTSGSWAHQPSKTLVGRDTLTVPAVNQKMQVVFPPHAFTAHDVPKVLVSNSSGSTAPYLITVADVSSTTSTGFYVIAHGAPARTAVVVDWVAMA